MCEHGHHDHLPEVDLEALTEAAQGKLSRRRLLHAGAGLAAVGGAAAGSLGRVSMASAHGASGGRPVSTAGGHAYRAAMHIHASFSEGDGSMATQLGFAKGNAADALFFTDHDWRIAKLAFLEAVHFNAFSEAVPGGTFTWARQTIGTLSTATAAIVSSPFSPKDPSGTHGALHVRAASGSSGELLYLGKAPRMNYRGNITGLKLVLEVRPEQAGPDGWLEVRLVLSRQPAGNGRPAGSLVLVYRIGGGGAAGATRNGAVGTVTMAAPKGAWTTVTLSPIDDVKRLWPDLDARDNALYAVSVGAGARNGGTADGYFDYLRFQWGTKGQAAYDVQQSIVTAMQAKTSVRLVHAHELSYYPSHMNQFGGGVRNPAYPAGGGLNPKDNDSVWRQLVADAQSHGGVVSYNHPFGSGGGKQAANQAALLHPVAVDLLANRLHGARVVEVGYALREGATLATHLALWDVLTRNGIFVVGTGVSDSHGESWANTYTTSLYASALTEPALITALGKGQAFCSKLGSWSGALDIDLDGSVPMGGIRVAPGKGSGVVHVSAVGMPSGGKLEVLATAIDYAGPTHPDPNTTLVRTLTPADLAGGPVAVNVSKQGAAFGLSVRTQVRNAGGVVVGIGNPVAWLSGEPPAGKPAIPPARRV